MTAQNTAGLDETEYRPELLSRRGELVAWGLTLLVAASGLILRINQQGMVPAVPILGIFLFLSAASISLGNWMDRRTRICLDEAGITFDNGLRHARLDWDEVRQVQVFPSAWGKKVRVLGPQAHFDFHTLGEVKVQGEVKGRMGFRDGEEILKKLLGRTGLKPGKRTGAAFYYSRE